MNSCINEIGRKISLTYVSFIIGLESIGFLSRHLFLKWYKDVIAMVGHRGEAIGTSSTYL